MVPQQLALVKWHPVYTVESRYIIHPRTGPKWLMSCWMIKPVGPNSSPKCHLYCAKQPNPRMLSWPAALCWLVPSFKSSSLSRITTFSFQVVDITGELDDISVDDITGFYCIKFSLGRYLRTGSEDFAVDGAGQGHAQGEAGADEKEADDHLGRLRPRHGVAPALIQRAS